MLMPIALITITVSVATTVEDQPKFKLYLGRVIIVKVVLSVIEATTTLGEFAVVKEAATIKVIFNMELIVALKGFAAIIRREAII